MSDHVENMLVGTIVIGFGLMVLWFVLMLIALPKLILVSIGIVCLLFGAGWLIGFVIDRLF